MAPKKAASKAAAKQRGKLEEAQADTDEEGGEEESDTSDGVVEVKKRTNRVKEAVEDRGRTMSRERANNAKAKRKGHKQASKKISLQTGDNEGANEAARVIRVIELFVIG